MKTLLNVALILSLTACYTAKLEKPQKYDIYLYDICKPKVVEYIDLLKEQPHYQTHKTLSVNDDYADFTYTSYMYPEDLLAVTYKFFGDNINVKLNSNVLKIKGVDKCDL